VKLYSRSQTISQPTTTPNSIYSTSVTPGQSTTIPVYVPLAPTAALQPLLLPVHPESRSATPSTQQNNTPYTSAKPTYPELQQ